MPNVHRLLPYTIALVALVLYIPVLSHGFVSLDDPLFITENDAVTEPTLAAAASVFKGFTGFLYIPLTTVSWQLTSSVFGMQAWAFHVVDCALHALCSVLVYFILKRLLNGSLWIAAGAALLFAVHPLHTEAVAWVSSRKDLLSAAFALASILSFLRAQDGDERTTAKSLFFFLLSLLSKPTAVLLPVAFAYILLQRNEDRRTIARSLWPFALLSFIFGSVAAYGGAHFLNGPTPVMFILYGLQSIGLLTLNALLPLWLSPMHYVPFGEQLLTPLTIAGGVIAVVLLIPLLLGISKQRWALPGLGALLFFLFLLPTMGTIQKGGLLFITADKYAYVPLLGLLLIDVWILSLLAKTASVQKGVATLFLVLAIPYAIATVSAAGIWKDDKTLFSRAAETHPDNPAALNGLGLMHINNGNYEEALAWYDRAQRSAPWYAASFVNEAEFHWDLGDQKAFTDTVEDLISSLSGPDLDRSPGMQGGVSALADKIRLQVMNEELAVRLLEQALKVSPTSAVFADSLGAAAFDAGDDEKALAFLLLAEKNGSRNPHVYYRLAELYSNAGNTAEVIRVMRKGISFDPGNEIAKDQLKKVEAAQ